MLFKLFFCLLILHERYIYLPDTFISKIFKSDKLKYEYFPFMSLIVSCFLKKEYGCGGFGSPRGDRNKYQLAMGDWATPMAKGKIRLSWYVPGKDDEEEEVFSYEQLHDKIVECIGNNEY